MATLRFLGILAAGGLLALCSADRAAADQPLPRCIRSDGPAGIRQYVPGRWGMVAVDVVNPADEPVEVLSAMYFGGHPSLQYGRRLWLPPGSKRSSWYPVLVPTDLAPGKSRVDVQSLLALQSGGREVLSGAPGGQMLRSGMLPVLNERPVTAMILDDDDEETHAALAAMRQSRALSALTPTLSVPLPASVETLDGLDQLVLASDRIVETPATLAAVRRWLYNGGRMWITLDRVRPATVSLLLGDAMRFQVVDRVGLTEVQIEGPIPGGTRPEPLRRFDEPVDLVRVVGPDLVPTHKVNGWPASFWQRAGRGSVLFTTLGPRGWIRPRTPKDPKPKSSSQEAPNMALAPLASLAAGFLQVRPAPPLGPDDLGDMVTDEIGYRIVGRGAVAWALGGFCGALLVVGLVLGRAGRLAWLGWIGPGMALAVAAGLGLVGRASRSAVPPTVAVAQFVEVSPEVEDIRASGLMALYQQTQKASPLGARRGGIFFPDMAGLGGTARRMVWTDVDAWHWENLALPAGMRTAPLSYATETTRPIRARATFGPDGLEGTISAGPLEDVDDTIIAAPLERAMAVHLRPDGTFAAGPRDVLAAGHYLGQTVLSDRQRRRQQVYQRLLQRAEGQKQPGYPSRPMLLAWAAPLDMHFLLAEDAERVGGALVAIPLELERPGPGTRVVIPSPLLPYRSVALSDDAAESVTFSNLEGRWLGPLSMPSRVMLRFQCPKELLPLRPEKALISVKLSAPSRKVEILGVEGGRVVSLATFQSPVGNVDLAVDRPEVLELEPQGGLRLGLSVGAFEGEASMSISRVGWKIDDVHLEVTGETLKP